jgi:hypothetical protein
MIIEKTATPSIRTIEPRIFSSTLFGLKSPKPIVDNVVIA